MSWFKRLFSKCCDGSGSCCGGEEKQEMPTDEPTPDGSAGSEEPAPVAVDGEAAPTVE